MLLFFILFGIGLPCGTKVTFGTYKDTKTTRVLLCPKCQETNGKLESN